MVDLSSGRSVWLLYRTKMICLFSYWLERKEHWFCFPRPAFLIALTQAVALAMRCLLRSNLHSGPKPSIRPPDSQEGAKTHLD